MDRRSDFAVDIPIKPLIVTNLAHVKSADHQIVECKQTTKGVLGKRPSTFEMKVSNYDLQYVGKSVAGGKRKHGYEWVMAVRNRRTGNITFAPFDVVRFTPKIEIPEEKRNEMTKVDARNFEETRRNLIMEFGTKRAKQALNSSLRNAVDEKATEQLFAHAMNYMQTNEEIKRARLDEEGAGQPDGEAGTSGQSRAVRLSSALPPCNVDAKTPAEIYNISDIVHDDLLDVLKPEAERFLLLSPNEARDEGHAALVMAIIQMTASMKNLEERTTRVAYCLYLSCLIRLNRLIGGRIRYISPSELSAHFSVPPAVLSDLMNKFTSAGGVSGKVRSWGSASKLNVTSLHKDMLLGQVVVLLLILSGQYAFNVEKALHDLGASEGKATSSKLTSICKALGCRLERNQKTGGQICILEKPAKQRNALLGKRALGGRGRKR